MNELVHTEQGKRRAGRACVKESTRTNDPERTKADILAVAEVEFGEKGLAGARIDEIAAATQTSKRMIYYYFGSKEGLYLAVLEEAYRRKRQEEADLHLEDMEPEAALRLLVAHTFERHLGNENFIRLVMSENIHRGEFMRKSQFIQELNVPAIEAVRDIYQRGVESGVFRPGLDPADIHASISALSFFNISNQHTFGLIFKLDTSLPEYQAQRRDNVVEMIWRYLRR
jgi:AcrR family transcriptional regulator